MSGGGALEQGGNEIVEPGWGYVDPLDVANLSLSSRRSHVHHSVESDQEAKRPCFFEH